MSSIPESALTELITECEELIDSSSGNLQKLESEGFDSSVMNSVYRDIHTIKGSAQLFGLNTLSMVAHSMEACLDPLRKKRFDLDSDLNDVLLRGLDLITLLLKEVKDKSEEKSYEEESKNYVYNILAFTVVRLNGCWDLISELGFGEPSQGTLVSAGPGKNEPAAVNEIVNNPSNKGDSAAKPEQVAQTKVIEDPKPIEKQAVSEKAQSPEVDKQTSVGETQPEIKLETEIEVTQQETATSPRVSKEKESNQPKEVGSIRVNVSLLDNLMNLVGELVLIRNQVLQHSNTAEDQDFVKLSQRLNVVTSELQNDVMKTRMQPIGNILSKFRRVVRDLSRELSKKVELVTEGDETELDKTLIEAVKDPLTHLVRNCVDHAIELPAERIQSGKKGVGTVHIKAYHEGGQVVVEVKDDGKGLHRDAIGNKAVEKGIISPEELANLTDREVQHLVFMPGFSTAQKVSNISGRGVGMDVVKTNIEKIGGIVDLNSIPGKETVFKLKIPLTLAIVPALIVQSNKERYAIPQVKVVELVRVEGSSEERFDANKVEFLQGKPVYRLRGNLLPLVDLNETLNINGEGVQSFEERISKGVNLVFLSTEDSYFGLIVDEIEDSADIVVKPLSQFLKKLNLYAGATIMGDGDVVLILDVSGVNAISSKGDVGEKRSSRIAEVAEDAHAGESSEYIIVDIGASAQYAMPLVLVNRLEVFENKNIEWSGEQEIVRYREGILPILELSKELEIEKRALVEAETFSTVVVSKGERSYGFRVKEILDVVNVSNQIDDSLKDRSGILGNLILNDEVIVVVDPLEVIDEAQGRLNVSYDGGGHNKAKIETLKKERSKCTIVLAEDSTFFRNQMLKVLTEAGYIVRPFVNGELAFNALIETEGKDVACVVSDIEMPAMNGLEFVSSFKHAFPNSPLKFVAVTTKSGEKDQQKGIEAGFTKYLEKLNPEELIRNVDIICGIKFEGDVYGNAKHTA